MAVDLSEMEIVSGPSVTVSAADFRAVSAFFPSGVTVITRRLPDGRPYGITVSSFTTVSLEPALILICIDRSSRFTDEIRSGAPFLVNVLSEGQELIARRFADRLQPDRFQGIGWNSGWSGMPLLEGTVATFGCSVNKVVEAGDHLVVIAAVHELHRHEGRALVWCERQFHSLPRHG